MRIAHFVKYGKAWLSIAMFCFIAMIPSCISSDLVIKTEGTFKGTYVSVDATYDGPLSFDFKQVEEAIDAQGTITIENERIDFEGHGTMTKSPITLDLNVTGTGLTMHLDGALNGNHLTGSYTFTSSKWGSDSGSIDMTLW